MGLGIDTRAWRHLLQCAFYLGIRPFIRRHAQFHIDKRGEGDDVALACHAQPRLKSSSDFFLRNYSKARDCRILRQNFCRGLDLSGPRIGIRFDHLDRGASSHFTARCSDRIGQCQRSAGCHHGDRNHDGDDPRQRPSEPGLG